MKLARIACAIAFPLALLMSAPASAQKLDLGKVKCGDWLKAPKEAIGVTLAWLDGYYPDQDADAIIDFDKIARDAEKLAEACAKSPDKMLGDVAEDVFGN